MAARTMAIIVSTVVLSSVMLTNKSLADSTAKLGAESPLNAIDSQGGVEMGSPIPNAPEIDKNDSSATTLELRVANNPCSQLAHLIDFAKKCELASPEPLNPKERQFPPLH